MVGSSEKPTGGRTLFLVEDVEQNDADFVVRLNVCVQQDRNDVLHGIFKWLAFRVGTHGQILHTKKRKRKELKYIVARRLCT